MKHNYPNWVISHRKPGTELRHINGHYYLYAVSSYYDPVRKKGRKKTGVLLGKITEADGFVASEERRLKKGTSQNVDLKKITVRECGFTDFLEVYGKSIEQKLKEFFPKHYKLIIYIAYARFVHNSPINRMPLVIGKSMLSVGEKEQIYPQKLSATLAEIGRDRSTCVAYMQSFIKSGEHLLIDMTNMFNGSTTMYYTKEGYNSEMVFDTQVNLMYIYSPSSRQPLFYKILNGNSREVVGFKNTLLESGLKDAVIIADKGFYSKANIDLLEQNGLSYIIPLKRDNTLIDYAMLSETSNDYFKYEDRIIWTAEYEKDGFIVRLFKDDQLKTQEQKDYLKRIDAKTEGYTREKFNERLQRFGTFALLSNLKDTQPQQIYAKYKSRNAIEVMFDGVKTVLKADVSYMQKEETLNGWMFVNHVALQWYYIIYALLVEHELLSKYSVSHFVTELKEHRKVFIGDKWVEEPLIKQTKKILTKLNIYSVKQSES